MAGAWAPNEEKLKKVYERIREEEEERARRDGISPAELEARIKQRNESLKEAYEKKYGNLSENLKSELGDGDKKLMEALQGGKAGEIDAARAYKEHKDIYASDDELEAITRNQRKRAELDVSLEIAAEQARIAALVASGDITEDQRKQMAAELETRKQAKNDEIAKRSKSNMEELREKYYEATDKTQTFDQLILEETSGYSQLEIQDLVATGGKLSDEDEIYYAIAGVGTDEDKIKEVLKGKTPDEIQAIREKYEAKHGEGSFDNHILGDLSGREDLDIGHQLKYGDPSTFAAQLEAAKDDPEKRKKLLAGMEAMLLERKEFEKHGIVGSIFDAGADPMNSADQLARAVERAQRYNDLLDQTAGKAPEDLTPEELAALSTAKNKFEMNFSGAMEAQEQVRAQIDAYTDVAAQVCAAVIGIAVTIVTAGTASLAIAALYGAIAAAATTMVVKGAMKGAAYSWEDAGVDLAVGAVDAAVSALTAGVGKAITTAVKSAVAAQVAKRAAKEGAEKVTEAMAKKWMKEALEELVGEALENAIQAAPSAFVEAILNDDTWNSDDPWGQVAKATGTAAGIGAGVGVGAKVGGDVAGGIKGKLKGEPTVDVGGGGKPVGELPPADTTPSGGGVTAKPDTPKPDTGVKLPPEADLDAVAREAAAGKPPAGATDADLAKADANGSAKSETDAPATKTGGETDGPAAKTDADVEPPTVKIGVEPPAVKTGDVEPVTPVTPGPKKGKPSADDVGNKLSDDDLATRYGMPTENVKKIQQISDAEGVVIDIRPTTPHAEPMLREGTALPKPEKLKAKTINEIDVMIGCGSEADLGKVGFFRPAQIDRPKNFDALSPELQAKIDKRIAQRLEEIADYWQDMKKLVDAGKIEIRPDGVIINKGLTPGGKELPFTGDHDIFDIRAKDGTALTPEKYQDVKAKLLAADAGVMHGGVTGWEFDAPQTFHTEAGQKSYKKMVGDHSPGGEEPLVRIGDGEPKAVWYEPATPLDTPPGDRLLADSDIDRALSGLGEAPSAKATTGPEGPAPKAATAEPEPPTVKSVTEPDAPGPKTEVPDAPAPKSVAEPLGVTPVDPGPAKSKPSAEDVGKPLSEDDLAVRYGMPKENVTKLKNIAESEGVLIDIRPTTPYAEPMLREGSALPKPEKLKAKTINDIDVMIGCGSEADLGKVGFFRPDQIQRPPDFDTLPPEMQRRVHDRIVQRLEEIADYSADMRKLIDKQLIEIRPDGIIVNKGLSPGGEKPFTGDHDIFDIRKRDGSALTPHEYQLVKAKLLAADAGVMHGGVTGWEFDAPETFNTPAGQSSYKKMVGDHTPGGKEPLVRFGDGEPKAVWYEPATASTTMHTQGSTSGVAGHIAVSATSEDDD
jgi:hypothetical protein